MSSVFLTTKGQSKLLAITDTQCGTVEPYTFKIGIGTGLSPLSTDLVSPIYGPAPIQAYRYVSPDTGNVVNVIVCEIPDDLGNFEITELGIWDKQGDMIIGVVFDPPEPIKVDPTRFTSKRIAIPFYAVGILANLSLSVSSTTIRYTHTQSAPTTQWRIEHKLNRTEIPVVQVTTFDGRRIEPTKINHNANVTDLYFDEPVSGVAVLIF